jgi:hypothetical protein
MICTHCSVPLTVAVDVDSYDHAVRLYAGPDGEVFCYDIGTTIHQPIVPEWVTRTLTELYRP